MPAVNLRGTFSTAIAAAIGTKKFFKVGFEIIEELQRHVIGVATGMGRGCQVEIDAAGEGSDAIDAAVLAAEVEERAVAAVVDPLRQQIEKFLLRGKDIGPAVTAGAGAATDRDFGLAVAEGMRIDPLAETVGIAVKEGELAAALAAGPLAPDDTPFQLLDFAEDDGGRAAIWFQTIHGVKHWRGHRATSIRY